MHQRVCFTRVLQVRTSWGWLISKFPLHNPRPHDHWLAECSKCEQCSKSPSKEPWTKCRQP